jgi:hypothetical protein
MSLLVPCSSCGSRESGKNAWLCWAWNRADNTRVAWKQKVCLTCFSATALPLIVACEEGLFQCPACHSDPEGQLDPIYLTYVMPGQQKAQAELATCGSCAVEIRTRAMVGAEQMPDRESQGVGATAPTQTSVSGWDALGLRPLGQERHSRVQ